MLVLKTLKLSKGITNLSNFLLLFSLDYEFKLLTLSRNVFRNLICQGSLREIRF